MSDDPYVIPGTKGVLRNKLRIKDAERLKQAEASRVQQRLLHIARKGPRGPFNFERLCETHRYLFQDVYDWAGQPRSGLRMFAKREYEGGPYHHFTSEARIASEAKRIFDGLQRDGELKCLDRATFADKASALFVEINQLHPFREGNGRAQVQFTKALAEQAGHPLHFQVVTRERMVEASILGSKGDPSMMRRMFEEISDPVRCYHLEKAITALRSFNFDWNERYIATVTPGQSYDGVFVGRSGEQFMLGRGDRITIGFVADLERIPARAEQISFTASDRGFEAARREAIENGISVESLDAAKPGIAAARCVENDRVPPGVADPGLATQAREGNALEQSAATSGSPQTIEVARPPLIPARRIAKLEGETLHAAVAQSPEVARPRDYARAHAGQVFADRQEALKAIEAHILDHPRDAMATATAVRTKPEQFGGLLGKRRVGLGANAERAAALVALPALVEAVKTYAEAYHAAWQALTQKLDAEAVQESIAIPAPSRKLEAVMDGTLNPEKLSLDERKDLFKEASAIEKSIKKRFAPEEITALSKGDHQPLKARGISESLASTAKMLAHVATASDALQIKRGRDLSLKKESGLENGPQ